MSVKSKQARGFASEVRLSFNANSNFNDRKVERLIKALNCDFPYDSTHFLGFCAFEYSGPLSGFRLSGVWEKTCDIIYIR